jgi:hypothetical protein
MEEIQRYAVQELPSARFVPSDIDFSRHTKGLGDRCTCCGEDALEMGSLAGFDFRRCTWCGGIFIKRDDLRRLMRGASADDERVGRGEAGLGVLEFFLMIGEILVD